MLVMAAGRSTRMGEPKQHMILAGRPVLIHTLQAMQDTPAVSGIILVTRPEDTESFSAMAVRAGITKLLAVVPGGSTRQQSVAEGLKALPPDTALVGIHDGARPLITPAVIAEVIAAAACSGAAAAAVPVNDTLKRADDDGFVQDTPDRRGLWRVQTPQVFARAPFCAAMAAAEAAGEDYTDDCQLMEHAGYPVRLVKGSPTNIKLTDPQDVPLVCALLHSRTAEEETKKEAKAMRIGHGYDVHRLIEKRPLILGGVTVPWSMGLLGHSDADVLAHAIMDALLGAAALGDIGALFPDTDPAYAGADSLQLLQIVAARVGDAGYTIGNIDATVLAQKPKLAPYIPAMRERLAAACGIAPGQISIKATTEEGLGFTGALEGIAAHAVCLLHGE